MNIDYDRLRDLVRIAGGGRGVRDYATEHDAERDLENLAPDMARELLRLRDGVEELSEWVRKVMNANIDKPQYSAALTPIWFQVRDLLEGDTE